jgi:hypothetical protein
VPRRKFVIKNIFYTCGSSALALVLEVLSVMVRAGHTRRQRHGSSSLRAFQQARQPTGMLEKFVEFLGAHLSKKSKQLFSSFPANTNGSILEQSLPADSNQ